MASVFFKCFSQQNVTRSLVIHLCSRSISTQSTPLLIRNSPVLCAEPMKKKKKVDVNIIIQKEQKKKRRIEKVIKKLESRGGTLKPIDEIEGTPELRKTLSNRKRPSAVLSFEESEARALLLKQWSAYKFRQHVRETHAMWAALAAQQEALDELRKESEDLYQEAIQMDPNLIPFSRKGPSFTPKKLTYDPPDGEYVNTTKTFDKVIGTIDLKKIY